MMKEEIFVRVHQKGLEARWDNGQSNKGVFTTPLVAAWLKTDDLAPLSFKIGTRWYRLVIRRVRAKKKSV